MLETYGIVSLVPVAVALILAFWTKDALLSLLVGCILGVCILGQNPIRGLSLLFQDALGNADFIWVLFIEVFIGILVAFFMKSGAIKAFTEWVSNKKLSKRGTEIMAYLLGIFIFFSDYFSPLYVGNVMRPLTDNAKTSREYLAFVCDCTSAPICCLIPFTSWGVYVAGIVVGIGCIVDANMGQQAVIGAFKYNFYCWVVLILNGLLAVGIIPHFGPMKAAQKRAFETGEVYAKDSNPLLSDELDMIKVNDDAKPNLFFDFAAPAIIIIGVTVGTYVIIGSARTLEAFIAAVFYQFLIMLIRRSATVKQMMDAAVLGIKAVNAAIYILAMAYCINSITKSLGAANFLINLTHSWMTPFWLLTITFILCAVISFLTGTSWGTYGIMIPICLPIAFNISGGQMAPVVYGCIAAVMGGGCFGDHCSPISDTTILSSLAAGCDHIDHVKTQMPYALASAVIACGGYMILGAMI